MNRTRSLSTALYLIFLPLLLGSVGITSWLAHRAGDLSVREVATALGDSYAQRIRQRVRTFLDEPQLVNQVNKTEMRLGLVDPLDLDHLRLRFWTQLQDFQHVNYIYYGTHSGEIIGFQRELDGSYSYSTVDEDRRFITYALSSDFEMGAVTEHGDLFDPRTRPWFTAAVQAGETTWTDIYVWFGRNELCIDVVSPVNAPDGSFVGVLDAGYTLGEVSRFLEQLRIGTSGEAYIVDRDGLLVATSTGEPLVDFEASPPRRLSPLEIAAPISQFVAESLEEADATTEYHTPHHPTLGPLTVMVHPLRIDPRLQWSLVVAIPQSDFTSHYAKLTRQTVFLSVAAVLMTVLAILVFVRRLSGPLSQLVDAARRVQVGELDVDLPSPSSDEIGELTVAMEEMVRGLRERETIRDAFGRYVTQEVAEQVLSDPAAMRLGGVRRCVTILMSDLRGFTARSNQLEPEALVQLLNEYLGEMTASIVLHNGLIVEFIGDAILVLFGATGSSDDDALRACQCALDMHRRLDQMNTQLVARGTPRLQMGIGIHTGDVVVGNIGSEHRIKFGVVGDTVNTTARVESQTVGGQIFVSANTRQAVNADLSFGEAISTRVKGLAEPLWIHELQRADAAVDLVRLPFLHDHAVAHLYRIENKVVSEAFSPVDLTWDPSQGLQARSSDALQPLDDIMLVVWQEDGSRGHQLYCKVREVSGDGPYQNTLAVTAVTPTADTESDEALAVNSPSDTNDG